MSDVTLNTIITVLIAPTTLLLLKVFFEKKKDTLEEVKKDVKSITDKIDELHKDSKIQATATRNILRYRLMKNMSIAKQSGYKTQEEFQELCHLYESYKELGGNSVVDIMFEEYKKLEIKPENFIK